MTHLNNTTLYFFFAATYKVDGVNFNENYTIASDNGYPSNDFLKNIVKGKNPSACNIIIPAITELPKDQFEKKQEKNIASQESSESSEIIEVFKPEVLPTITAQENIAKPKHHPLSEAKQIALQVMHEILPFCEEAEIAGSVRRQKSFVKDIEIVALPKKKSCADIFGNITHKKVSEQWGQIISILGKTIKGNFDGKYIQIKLKEGITLDIFMPDENDFYRQLAIRTGSAEYSHKVIAMGWRKKGWCGTDIGLRKMEDCINLKSADGKSKWRCVNPNAELPPKWESEKEFFDWINVEFLPPRERFV